MPPYNNNRAYPRRPYYPQRQPYESGAAKGFREKMDYWKQKDFKMEFNILTAQALNLAVQANPALSHEEQVEKAKDYYRMLISLRLDEELRKEFETYANPQDTGAEEQPF